MWYYTVNQDFFACGSVLQLTRASADQCNARTHAVGRRNPRRLKRAMLPQHRHPSLYNASSPKSPRLTSTHHAYTASTLAAFAQDPSHLTLACLK